MCIFLVHGRECLCTRKARKLHELHSGQHRVGRPNMSLLLTWSMLNAPVALMSSSSICRAV